MGSFSLKDNNLYAENKNGDRENLSIWKFEKRDNIINEDVKNNYLYKKFSNRSIMIIAISLCVIVIVNISMFWLFSNSQSVIEIPENNNFKEYVENNVVKEQSIYQLLSKNKNKDSNEPKVINNTNDSINNIDVDKNISEDEIIDFKNIRNADIDNHTKNKISIGEKILEIDNNLQTNKVYRLNIGIFLTHDLANEYIQKLKKKYQDLKHINHYIVPVQFKNQVVYKVLIGDFASNDSAEKASEQLDNIEINSSVEEF